MTSICSTSRTIDSTDRGVQDPQGADPAVRARERRQLFAVEGPFLGDGLRVAASHRAAARGDFGGGVHDGAFLIPDLAGGVETGKTAALALVQGDDFRHGEHREADSRPFLLIVNVLAD